MIKGMQHRSRAVLGDKRHQGALGYPGDILMLIRYITGWVCVSQRRNEKGYSLTVFWKFQVKK